MSDTWSTDLSGAAHYAGDAPGPDRPTRAEAEADEHDDRNPTAGMVRCPRGCTTWFHGYTTDAAIRHAAEVHGLVVTR